MRTNFTLDNLKDLIEGVFNGNLRQSLVSRGKIPYENPNSEEIIILNEATGQSSTFDLAKYLNIKFYTYKERVVMRGEGFAPDNEFLPYQEWLSSLNFSLNEAYALVERLDEEVIASQDIDSATITGKISFFIQVDKVHNLDYYVKKLQSLYLGNAQDIQNSFGEKLKAYLLIGALLFDQEPTMTQTGECVIVSCNFKLSYLANAETFNDTKFEISLDGDDLYNENGEIVDVNGAKTQTKYKTMVLSKVTWQNFFAVDPLPMAERPDLTGYYTNALSTAKTLTFYDVDKELSSKFSEIFWRTACLKYDGKVESVKDINIPVYIRVTHGGHFYIFKDIIEQMQKTLTNNDFTIASISLRGYAQALRGE